MADTVPLTGPTGLLLLACLTLLSWWIYRLRSHHRDDEMAAIGLRSAEPTLDGIELALAGQAVSDRGLRCLARYAGRRGQADVTVADVEGFGSSFPGGPALNWPFRQTVVAFHLPGATVPAFRLDPRAAAAAPPAGGEAAMAEWRSRGPHLIVAGSGRRVILFHEERLLGGRHVRRCLDLGARFVELLARNER